jgi:hypothetical protein
MTGADGLGVEVFMRKILRWEARIQPHRCF